MNSTTHMPSREDSCWATVLSGMVAWSLLRSLRNSMFPKSITLLTTLSMPAESGFEYYYNSGVDKLWSAVTLAIFLYKGYFLYKGKASLLFTSSWEMFMISMACKVSWKTSASLRLGSCCIPLLTKR